MLTRMSKLYLIIFLGVLNCVTWTTSHTCPPKCPENEEFIKCGSLCQETCLTRGQNCTRVGIGGIKCEDRCYCKKGYVRACSEDDPCMPIEMCQIILCAAPTTTISPPEPIINCTKPHEHYECGSACQTECRTLGEECPILNVQCNDACYCDKGYARACHANDSCIPVESCQKIRCANTTTTTQKPIISCTKPHEHYECGSACQTECRTLGEDCPIVNKRCNHDCYCDKGYARDENKRCIPIERCLRYWFHGREG